MTEYIGGVRYQPPFAPTISGDHWTDHAACRNMAPLFDPPTGREHLITALRRLRDAAAICHDCPVAASCLADGKRDGDWGIRGGVYLERGRPTPHPRPRNGAA